MIRFISAKDTLALRSSVLRNGAPLEDCYLDRDMEQSTFHLGYFTTEDMLVCILTCQQDKHGKLPGSSYRLRGMATHPEHVRKGYAKQLLEACMLHLQSQLAIDYLWFNAREVAFPFYESLGFEYMSDPFVLADIGVHKEMFKML